MPTDVQGHGSPGAVPATIAGFPTSLESFEVAGHPISLVTVRDLERYVDRERLLHDETVVPPYWAMVWGGARALAEHLASVPCVGATVLDVGCGLGLLALVAAARGARVTAIDRERAPIEFLQASAAASGLPVEAVVADIVAQRLGRRFDLVLAADLLYERVEFLSLARALESLLAPAGTLWLADPQRIDTTEFYGHLATQGLTVRAACVRELREEGALLRVRLVGLSRS